jgi:tRNA uridine 5-carbamoylmethylation protein Kti12
MINQIISDHAQPSFKHSNKEVKKMEFMRSKVKSPNKYVIMNKTNVMRGARVQY